MVQTLLTVIGTVVSRRIPLAEAAGAGALIVGAVQWFGAPAGWVGVGVGLLAKSLEWDLQRGKRE
jgi:hypothetical protein